MLCSSSVDCFDCFKPNWSNYKNTLQLLQRKPNQIHFVWCGNISSSIATVMTNCATPLLSFRNHWYHLLVNFESSTKGGVNSPGPVLCGAMSMRVMWGVFEFKKRKPPSLRGADCFSAAFPDAFQYLCGLRITMLHVNFSDRLGEQLSDFPFDGLCW